MENPTNVSDTAAFRQLLRGVLRLRAVPVHSAATLLVWLLQQPQQLAVTLQNVEPHQLQRGTTKVACVAGMHAVTRLAQLLVCSPAGQSLCRCYCSSTSSGSSSGSSGGSSSDSSSGGSSSDSSSGGSSSDSSSSDSSSSSSSSDSSSSSSSDSSSSSSSDSSSSSSSSQLP
ncbi:hypothetical protein OEZ85_012281 [Tetradesmus obliquus]|uniref:REJ domain-containing protein n=1 Tax=Tetradesmus obliquus TaxID=3088 RepID=A0ABY8TV63_TETOB|nr:hypothetical protein OEZ85_012281 [Tetradesmus obliquus]